MLKYRIKEVIDDNNKSYFYPQIKRWCGWVTLSKVVYDEDLIPSHVFFKLDKETKAKEIIDKDYVNRMSKVIQKVQYKNYTPINIELNNILK